MEPSILVDGRPVEKYDKKTGNEKIVMKKFLINMWIMLDASYHGNRINLLARMPGSISVINLNTQKYHIYTQFSQIHQKIS